MTKEQLVLIVVGACITSVFGIIGFFLKRTMTNVDKHGQDIDTLKCEKADKTSVEDIEDEVKKIKSDYITKEDFFREQGKTDRKLDRIMDILLELKGGKSNG